MKRSSQKKRAEYEQDEFLAYGEYSYNFQHVNKAPDGESGRRGPEAAAAAPPPVPRPVKRKKNRWMIFLYTLVGLTVTLIIVTETIFKVQSVIVIGCENRSPYEIVTLSGLAKGESILGVKEADVEAALKNDYTIIYKGMKKDYPNTIYLYIEERKPVAVMRWIGMQYLLDEEGLVMEEQSSIQLPENMPIVTGFNVSTANAGQRLIVQGDKQLKAYSEIMKELRLQLYTENISEINLANPSSIYLITKEGLAVRLGDGEYMRAKICAMRVYMAYLRQLGKMSGMLDISIPEDAKFMPEG